MRAIRNVLAVAFAVALSWQGLQLAQAQKPASKATAEPKAGKPVMTLKVYDESGNVLVNVSRKVDPKPKNNAFDVMRAIVTLDFTTYAGDPTASPPLTGGAFINAIAGVFPPPDFYWILYIDHMKSMDKGICDVVITQDTLIEWKIEKLTP